MGPRASLVRYAKERISSFHRGLNHKPFLLYQLDYSDPFKAIVELTN